MKKVLFKVLNIVYVADIFISFPISCLFFRLIRAYIEDDVLAMMGMLGTMSFQIVQTLIISLILFIIFTEIIIKYTNKSPTQKILITWIIFMIMCCFLVVIPKIVVGRIVFFKEDIIFLILPLSTLILCVLYIYISKIMFKLTQDTKKNKIFLIITLSILVILLILSIYFLFFNWESFFYG